MGKAYFRQVFTFFILLSNTFGYARIFQPSIKHQKIQHPIDDELEMEHIEDIENAFHSSSTPQRDLRSNAHGGTPRAASLLPWRRTSSTGKVQDVSYKSSPQTISKDTPPETTTVGSMDSIDDSANKESAPHISSFGRITPLINLGLKRTISPIQNEQEVENGKAYSETSTTTLSRTPSATRVVSQNSIVIDPTAITMVAGTLSKSLGGYMSHSLISISVAALVYAVTGKIGDTLMARFQHKNNSKYIIELENKLLHFDIEREKEKSKLLSDFQDQMTQAQNQAENNMILKVEATRSKVVKLAQIKIDELIERNKKLKFELSKYIKISQALHAKNNNKQKSDSIGIKQEDKEDASREEIKRLETQLFESNEKLNQEMMNQKHLENELLEARALIQELENNLLNTKKNDDAASSEKKDDEEEERKEFILKNQKQYEQNLENARKESIVLMDELKQKHKSELMQTTEGYERELVKLKELVSRAMMARNASNSIRETTAVSL